MSNLIRIIILFLIPVWGISQNTVEGVVYGKEGDKEIPLTGVNIYWLGTSFGTISDVNGEFSIEKSEDTDRLIIRFVGYRPDTIDVSQAPNPMRVVLFSLHELDEVVVQARESGTHISRMDPLSTQKVTGQELHRAACCNLSESFTTNATVDVSFSDALTGAKQIQLLGLSGTYVQMQTENIPNFYGLAKSFGLEYIPGNWMESISISKGAASVINGYESITGQINVEYKKPQNSEKIFVNLYANDAMKFEFNANSSVHINDKLTTMVLAHASYNDKKIDHNQDGFMDKPLVRQYNLFNRWNYRPGKAYNLQAGIKYLEEQRLSGQMNYKHGEDNNNNLYGIDIDSRRVEAFIKNGYIFDEESATSIGWMNSASMHEQTSMYGNTNYRGEQKSFYSNLIFSTTFGNEHDHGELEHLLTNQADDQHDEHTEHEGHKHETPEENTHATHDEHEGHDHEGEAAHAHENNDEHAEHSDHDHDKPSLLHTINTGVSWKYDIYDEQVDSNKLSAIENIPGTFFEYTMQLPEKLTLMAGIRADYHNKYGVFVTPRSHLKYDFTKNTNLRLAAGKGFRTARVLAENNILLASSRSIDIQNELKMEEAWNYGISLTQYLDISGHEMTISADYYRTDFINQIIVDLDSDVHKISFYNLDGKSFSNNYQLQLDYELIKNLDVTAAFRYTDVQSTYDGVLKKRPLTSDYKGLFTVSYATNDQGWQFDFTTQFNGGGRIPSTAGLPQQYQREETFNPYTIMNFQATKYLGMFELYAGVENITDFVQKNPVIAAESPFGPNFDSSLIWGPVHGRKIYLGMRFAIDRQ